MKWLGEIACQNELYSPPLKEAVGVAKHISYNELWIKCPCTWGDWWKLHKNHKVVSKEPLTISPSVKISHWPGGFCHFIVKDGKIDWKEDSNTQKSKYERK